MRIANVANLVCCGASKFVNLGIRQVQGALASRRSPGRETRCQPARRRRSLNPQIIMRGGIAPLIPWLDRPGGSGGEVGLELDHDSAQTLRKGIRDLSKALDAPWTTRKTKSNSLPTLPPTISKSTGRESSCPAPGPGPEGWTRGPASRALNQMPVGNCGGQKPSRSINWKKQPSDHQWCAREESNLHGVAPT